MLNRRTLLSTSVAAIASVMPAVRAGAKGLDFDMEPRGGWGVFERLPKLDLESELAFYTSYRTWVRRDVFRAASRRATQIFREKGINPRDNDLPIRDVVQIL